MLADRPKFDECFIFNLTFISFEFMDQYNINCFFWQISYNCGILRQDYGIISSLPTGSHSGQYIYRTDRNGLITASDKNHCIGTDCARRAEHCNLCMSYIYFSRCVPVFPFVTEIP